MTVVNKSTLYGYAPLRLMEKTKRIGPATSYGLSEAGYDIRVKQEVKFRKLFGLFPQVKVGDGPWKSGRFCLASIVEKFDMPSTLVGVLHDKSTWAREGISIFNTVIEPGWAGFLTIEIVFHGNNPITIPAGAGIGQVLFSMLDQKARYDGKYQYQPDKPVGPIYSN